MKRTALRRVSKKRALQLRAYAIMRPIFLANHPFCEADPTCLGRSVEIHHIRGRSGDLLTDERYLIAICRSCHDWIHSHPNEARKRGLLK